MSRRRNQLLSKLPPSFTFEELITVGCYKSKGAARRQLKAMIADEQVRQDGEKFRLTRRPVCTSGEGPVSGQWRLVKSDGVIAEGPSTSIIDSEGRKVGAVWAAVEPETVHPSHDIGGTILEKFPREFQARDRGGISSRVQMERMLSGFDAARLVLPSSTPVDSAPVVWRSKSGPFWVLAGNGRAAVIKAALKIPEKAIAYSEAMVRQWPALQGLFRWFDGPVILVRIAKTTKRNAVKLAAASQAAGAAPETQLEKAVGVARSLGVEGDPLQAAPFFWVDPITPATVQALIANNPTWWAEVSADMDAAKRRATEANPEALTETVVGILLASLPADALAVQSDRLQEAEIGTLGALWSIESGVQRGRIDGGWSLRNAIGAAARLYQSAGSMTIAKLTKRITSTQTTFDEGDPLIGLDPSSAALGVLLLKTSRRKDPTEAAADALKPYVEAALADDPNQVTMFGERPNPARVLAMAAKWRDPRPIKNPRADQWVLLGDEVSFDLHDGTHAQLNGPWVIATEPEMSSVFLVRIDQEVDVLASKAAAKAWKAWTKGKPDRVFRAHRPDRKHTRRVEGEIVTIYYRAVYKGKVERRYHPFDRPGPLLVAYTDGPQIERGQSRYTVEPRGIVG